MRLLVHASLDKTEGHAMHAKQGNDTVGIASMSAVCNTTLPATDLC